MPKLSKSDLAAKVSANEARRRKEVALAELREMEVAERAGKLLPADQVRSALVTINSRIRDAVLRMPDKLAPQVVAAKDARDARAIMLAECKAILRNLSDELRLDQ